MFLRRGAIVTTMLTTLIYRSRVHPDRPPVDLDALVHRASSKICPLVSPAFCCLTACSFSVSWKGLRRHFESLFSEIQSDPRHRDVRELMRDYQPTDVFTAPECAYRSWLFETDGALEEILRFSTFGHQPITTGCSGCLAPHCRRRPLLLTEPLQPSRWR